MKSEMKYIGAFTKRVTSAQSLKTAIYIFLLLGFSPIQAQVYPLQVTTRLNPPYSVYLSDYATPGNGKLQLIVSQRDLTRPSYQIRLRLSVELNGQLILQTSGAFNPAPINLDPSQTVLAGADLQPYLDSRNLDFVGISRPEYEQSKALPEGSYQVCFTAYDYHRQDIAVSAPSCSFFWLSKNEPPITNFPACGTALPFKTPQQITFAWLPRNTSSPNSAGDTQYEFSLYETRPAGRNPNDVVLTTKPIYQTITDNTQLMYSAAEPLLFENMKYVWRVRAIDKEGRDQFRNNGYSETCTFTYGGTTTDIQLLQVENLQVQGLAQRRGHAAWNPQEKVDGYAIAYRKKGSSNEWFSQQIPQDSLSIFDLEPNTEYEVRVQSYLGAVYGPYSDIKNFKTLKPPVLSCGDVIPKATASGLPLPYARKGMIIDVQGIDLTLDDVQNSGGPGTFKGTGTVSIPYFAGAVFHVAFNNLFIDGTRTAIRGRVDFLTKNVESWIKDEQEQQKKQQLTEQQEANREQWKDTDFYKDVVYYNDITIDSMYQNEDGEVIITDNDGNTYINKDIPAIVANAPGKAIIFQDKNGDQWVRQKDGTFTKVPGGGLSPTYNVNVSDDALNVVKSALISLHNQYSEDTLTALQDEMDAKRRELENYITSHNDEILDSIPNVQSDTANFESLFFNFEELRDQAPEEDDPFVQLSTEAKQKEFDYNRGALLNILGNDDNIAIATGLVARELNIDDMHVSDYLNDAKQNGKSDSEVATKIKESIVALLDSILSKVNEEVSQDNVDN